MTGTASSPRRLAIDLLVRIEASGAYANLVTDRALDQSALSRQDRGLVTDLVYGTTRLRRACRHLVDRHRKGSVSDRVRAALDIGAYQLLSGRIPPHAAVSETVEAAPARARGLVNAVLRRVATDVASGIQWPDRATELSYPDWIVDALSACLGPEADAALAVMNQPATTHRRSDGYVQDLASQRVVDLLAAEPGDLVYDMCSAPGGKATGIAATGARVIAGDRSLRRSRLVSGNAEVTSTRITTCVVDATSPAFPTGRFDRVLVDAPCSGLGVLRRRPDARWRIEPEAVTRLATLQKDILRAAVGMVRPGGLLLYSVCTLTEAENQGVVSTLHDADLEPIDTVTMAPTADADGMFVARWRRR